MSTTQRPRRYAGARKNESPDQTPQRITIEIDRARIEETLDKLRDEIKYWARRGTESKVRFKFRGEQVLPDIPVAALMAAEAATFWWGGLLRALAVNLGGKALFDVELISNAEPHLSKGKEHLMRGDVDDALSCFERAAAAERGNAAAFLNIGVCHKVRGDRSRARAAFERASDLDKDGEVGDDARTQLDKLGSG